MSKLHQIREQLAANPSIIIVGENRKPYEPVNVKGSESYEIFIIPKPWVSTDFDSLQKLLESLITGITPSALDPYLDMGNGDQIIWAKLYFEEVLGTITPVLTVNITDPDLLLTLPPVSTVEEEVIKIRRHIAVWLYPALKYAQDAIRGQNKYSLRDKEAAEFRAHK